MSTLTLSHSFMVFTYTNDMHIGLDGRFGSTEYKINIESMHEYLRVQFKI